MNRSSTTTIDAGEETTAPANFLESSLGSISSPRRYSNFSKPYKQASNFFLTRRLFEALATIRPLVTVLDSNRLEDNRENQDDGETTSAPIARADRRWRVKIWSFYLTLLNAIADLGPEEGKEVFGNTSWQDLLALAQDGTIWEEVVQVGYEGIEGKVDADVVLNL